MNHIQYLYQVKQKTEQIEKKREWIREARCTIYSRPDELNSHGVKNMLYYVKDAETELFFMEGSLWELKAEVLKTICNISDNKEFYFLVLRYVDLCSWGETAKKLGTTKQRLHSIHRRAIKSFKKFYDGHFQTE